MSDSMFDHEAAMEQLAYLDSPDPDDGTHRATRMGSIPRCDINASHGDAVVDGATRMGPWAYMCKACFESHGVGLGLGRGQVLVLREATDGQ